MENIQARRDFLRLLAIGGGGLIVIGKYRFLFADSPNDGILKAIVVDFSKCTGCRTCETVCSAKHYPVVIEGEKLDGLGNPKLANIQVFHYNPDVDIPTACANCPDSPCVANCPSQPDAAGIKAIYRDPVTKAIRTNHAVCIGCGTCEMKCESLGAGIIKMNAETGNPEHICDHCGGDPQCVKHCPYGALSFADIDIKHEFAGMNQQEIAERLFERFYN